MPSRTSRREEVFPMNGRDGRHPSDRRHAREGQVVHLEAHPGSGEHEAPRNALGYAKDAGLDGFAHAHISRRCVEYGEPDPELEMVDGGA